MTVEESGAVSARATYTDLLRARGVSALFGVALTHVLGTSLQIFALSVFVFTQTGSALWSGIAFAAGFLPYLIGGALLTSLSDRWPPRALLASGALTRAASAFVLAFGDLSPAVAIATVAVVTVWQPVPMAAQSVLLTHLVPGDRYVLGRSVLNLIGSGAQLFGLAAGGAAVHWLGISAAFGAAGALQLLGLLAVAAIPATKIPRTLSERWQLRATWRGNGELLRDRVVRHILLSWWLPPTLLVGAEAMVVAYMGERGQSAAPTGLLLAAFPAGAAVGDLVVGRFFPTHLRRRSTPWLFALVGAPLLPLTLHPGLAVTWLASLSPAPESPTSHDHSIQSTALRPAVEKDADRVSRLTQQQQPRPGARELARIVGPPLDGSSGRLVVSARACFLRATRAFRAFTRSRSAHDTRSRPQLHCPGTAGVSARAVVAVRAAGRGGDRLARHHPFTGSR